MAFLITPTLLNAVDWYNNATPFYKHNALVSLGNILNRKWNSNPAMERGTAYEAMLYKNDLSLGIGNSDLAFKFDKAYDMIHAEGHIYQKAVKHYFSINKKPYVLYGKTDVFFKDRIYDIKTTGKFKGKNKYLSTWQHKAYCYCGKVKKFTYIVYEFNGSSDELVDIHFIDYKVGNFDNLERELKDKIKKVVYFLNSDPILRVAYITKFNR